MAASKALKRQGPTKLYDTKITATKMWVVAAVDEEHAKEVAQEQLSKALTFTEKNAKITNIKLKNEQE